MISRAALPGRVGRTIRVVVSHPRARLALFVFTVAALSALAFVPAAAEPRASAARGPRAAQPQGARPAQAPPTAPADEKREFERLYASWPRLTIPVPADGAAVVVVKFADFQCPPCSGMFFALRPVFARYQAKYPGAVRLVVKDYPLHPACNPYVPSPIHPAACDAAVAVRLARQHGKGEALEEWFYGHQETMTPASVRDAARIVGGVPPAEFDLNRPRVLEQVMADVALAHQLTVTQTPTFFVNGTKMPAVTADGVDLAIEIELRKAGRMK